MKANDNWVPSINERDVRRFYEHVVDEGGHSIWTGFVRNGYGRFHIQVGHQGRIIMAHRFAYVIGTGDTDIQDLDIRHVGCREKSCVRVAHLGKGTRSDNMIDAARDGTLVQIMTTTTVPEVEEYIDFGMGDAQIAEIYGVSTRTINAIRRGDTWSWLTGRGQ